MLLGCGDPRHILYTSWCILQAGDLSLEQKLCATACDIEPSIIARNIILYTLIHDENDPAMIWSLFYSKLIDEHCLSLLMSCAAKLNLVGASLTAWHRTPFGDLIRFCDERTYSIVRQIWALYANGKVNPAAESKMNECQRRISATYQKGNSESIIMTAAYQAHPCLFYSMANCKTHSDMALAYATNGMTPANIYSAQSMSMMNPMMFRGLEQAADLHYGLDPTLGFHLALAYLPVDQHPHLLQSNEKGSRDADADRIHMTCFVQFKQWCQAFRNLMIHNRIKIYSFTGDMLDLCQAISELRTKKINACDIVGNFSLGPIHLLPEVPVEYDVIDTSNVSDSIGLLNVLLGCRGLLSEGLHSTICTDLLNLVTKTAADRDLLLEEILRVDVRTFATITGLTLLGSSTKVSSSYANYSAHNILPMFHTGTSCPRTSITLEWKYLRASDICVNIEPEDFIAVYTKIYMRMFKHSISPLDLSGGLDACAKELQSDIAGMKIYSTPSIQTFVRLVHIGASKFYETDSSAIVELIQSIKNCAFHSQKNHERDLFCWFAILGLLPPPIISEMNDVRFYEHQLTRDTIDMTFFGPSPTEMILVKLLVPRHIIKEKLNKLICPILEMSIQTMGTDDRFASFHIAYVSEILIGADARSILSPGCTRYDCENFVLLEGNLSNYKYIACSAVVPISCLIGDNAKVCLSLSVANYKKDQNSSLVFGMSGVIYSALLQDKCKVSWTNYIPQKDDISEIMKTNQEVICNKYCNDLQNATWSPLIAVTKDGCVQSFVCKVSLANTKFLKDGNMVSCSPLLLEQSNMLRISLQLMPGKILELSLPLAIDVNNSTIQISRKEGYLRILIPFFKKSTCQSYLMFSTKGLSPSTEANFIHTGSSRVLLNSMPKLDLEVSKELNDWLYTLAASQLAIDERGDRYTGIVAASISMKSTINSMILHFSGNGGDGNGGQKHFRLFSFQSPTVGGAVMIYVNSIRLNFDDGSVVVDAVVCVVTGNPNNVHTVAPWFNTFIGDSIVVKTTDDELVLWRKALPIMNERTRNNWKHDKHCQYISSGSSTIPLNSKTSGRPVVCKCCMGKGMEGTEFEKAVGRSNPVYQHFFRVAISPLFNI